MKKILLTLGAVALISGGTWFLLRESPEHRIDREVQWKEEVKSYYITPRGINIGEVTVPGHTQRVTFYQWGIPKDELEDGDQACVYGEMSRDVPASENLSDLDRLALVAYNHGAHRIVLTKHKAYLVIADGDIDGMAAYEEIQSESRGEIQSPE